MNLSQIRQEANQRLQENDSSFRKLVLIHAAVTAGVSLLLMVVTCLSKYIAPQGGLSNMGTQDLLSTVQAMLRIGSTIAIPFWNAGLVFCALCLLRGKDHPPSTLIEGFRRWRTIAASLLIRGLTYFFVMIGCSFISSFATSILPLSPTLIEELNAFMEAPAFPLSTEMLFFLGACLVIYIASLCVLLVPKVYQHRLVTYRIMDDEPCTGLQSVIRSSYLMKDKRKQLLLLDLSFWWFYLLELLVSVLSIGDLVIARLNISLSIGAETAAWVFPIVALLARLVLYWYAKPKLAATYAVFYQRATVESTNEQEPPKPKQMPWTY